MDDFGQSLDVGKTLEQKREVEKMSEDNPKPVEQKPEPKAEEKKPEAKLESEIPNSRNEVSRKPKVVKKKAMKSAAKKAKKPKDDDFDFDDDEAGVGLYIFWAVVVIAALLVAMWIFTDWKLCIQF